jgi:hypothetical protein
MSFEDTKYLFFYVKDYTNTYTTTGYTLPVTPFTFIPVLDTGRGDIVSTTKLLWNFGDGTTSRDITATHAYSVPGTYNVTCHLYSTGGQGFESSFVQNIFVTDYVTDSLAISSKEVVINEAGHYQNPFTLTRFNSWQTYPALSTEGSTIMFYASGTGAPLFDAATYAADKYAHLKPYARFLVEEYNSALAQYELVPVESIKTLNNNDIYVKVLSSQVVRCDATDLDATLAGTSGNRLVYFVDDIVQVFDTATTPKAVFAMAYFDSTELYDNDSFGKNLPKSQYPILKQIVRDVYTPVFIDQGNINQLVITSNGIDGEGTPDSSFLIAPNKFVGQKIPFVVRIKDDEGYTSKTSPLLRYTSSSIVLCNEIRIQLLSSNDVPITSAAFYEDFGEFADDVSGGFFKGYLQCPVSAENVRLYARAKSCGPDYFTLPTYHTVISQPQSQYLHVADVEKTIEETSVIDHLVNTPALTGTYTAIAVPTALGGTKIWVADADQDVVYKFDSSGGLLLSASLAAGSSPSNMAADEAGDVWLSLFDGVSTVKMDQATGVIVASAVPPYTNQDLDTIAYYLSLSGHAGQNSILPTSVETDRFNNVWVSYSNPLSSFVCKYNSNGMLLSTFQTPENYQPTEIVTTVDNAAWIIYKDATAADPLSSSDKLAKISSNGNVSIYNINIPLWNITCDTKQSIWMTARRSDVVYFDATSQMHTIYTSITSDTIERTCDFAGIGCTTDGLILVVDDARKGIHYFEIANATTSAVDDITFVSLSAPVDLSGAAQNILNAYGDWTGFRYINKFYHRLGIADSLEGYSNRFNIYPTSGRYSVGKKNENFNPAAQYQAYVFQEPFVDYTRLMTDFFGTAVGDKDSSHEAVGKRTYERISNFFDNISNVDTCGIDALRSLHKMLNENFYALQSYSFNYPANIGRLMDLFSIKFTKLRGSRNKYATNFNSRGYNHYVGDGENFSVGVRYGRNRGPELDVYTTILTGGVDGYLVAFEKFSEQYHMVNTNLVSAGYVPYIDAGAQTYALSSYDTQGRWGWGLVLPSNMVAEDLDKYYSFYTYISSTDEQQSSGLINWSDPNTTITENISSIDQWNSIIEDMITYTLAEGLELLSATDI